LDARDVTIVSCKIGCDARVKFAVNMQKTQKHVRSSIIWFKVAVNMQKTQKHVLSSIILSRVPNSNGKMTSFGIKEEFT
jgi:hypothetical protein